MIVLPDAGVYWTRGPMRDRQELFHIPLTFPL